MTHLSTVAIRVLVQIIYTCFLFLPIKLFENKPLKVDIADGKKPKDGGRGGMYLLFLGGRAVVYY